MPLRLRSEFPKMPLRRRQRSLRYWPEFVKDPINDQMLKL